MPDFTSSLYLGFKHSSRELSGWKQLTAGVPAALSEPKSYQNLGRYLACKQGCETGLVAPSTLHLYFDLFHLLSRQNITVFVDENIYPVSMYGIEKLAVKKIPIYPFKHLDAHHFQHLLISRLQPLTTPVLLTDGFCPQCGKAAPIKEYASIMKPFGGRIIIDDTQAFGILGKRKGCFIYGHSGGGILQWLNVVDKNIITIVSLAKAFGVPMAIIAGSKEFINAFESSSKTRESSSPVSCAHVSAAYHAIDENRKSGDARRKKLFQNLALFKQEMRDSGIQLNGGFFPVQSIANLNCQQTNELYQTLAAKGFATVLVKNHQIKKSAVCIIINSEHTLCEIQLLTLAIKRFYAKANTVLYS